MALPYTAPLVSIASIGAQQVIDGGLALTTILALGTAPVGPDYPVIIPAQQVASIFGDPASPASVGYTLPLGMNIMLNQRQPVGSQNYQIMACRVGVARASGVIVDQTTGTPLTAFTVQGVGAYAGSKGRNIQVVIAVTGTPPNATITSIIVNDVTVPASPKQLRIYTPAQFNLATTANVIQAVNGDNPLTSTGSVVQLVAGAGNALIPAAQTVQLTGGTDGLGALASDTTVAPLLAASLYAPVDYVWAGFDAAAIYPALATHVNAALANYDWRKVVLGPKAGTTYATLTTSYNIMQSDRFAVLGHDALYGISPATGQSTLLDGFYGAAGICGLKAAGPTYETAIGFPLSGFSSVAAPSDVGAPLSAAQIDVLGGAGLLTLEQPYGASAPQIRDSLTTAPFSINNSLNAMAMFNCRDIDDAVSRVINLSLQPLKGRPMFDQTQQVNLMQSLVAAALGGLGDTINGVNSIVASIDPVTLNNIVNVSYITRYPARTINANVGYSFLPINAQAAA